MFETRVMRNMLKAAKNRKKVLRLQNEIPSAIIMFSDCLYQSCMDNVFNRLVDDTALRTLNVNIIKSIITHNIIIK